MLYGCDISAYQSSIPKGKDFEILKATEGLSYDDAPFQSRWAALAGTLRGAYHFAHPANNPVAEADHFLRVVERGGIRPGDLLVLDHETPGGSPAQDAAWALRWCVLIESATGIRPVVYTFLSFAEAGRCAGLGRFPLWIADPSRAPGHPRVPAPWTSWAIHQFGSPGGVDQNVFNGDRAAWLALGGQTQPSQQQEEPEMPYGQLAEGQGAITPIALPKGRYKTIGFITDNGLQGLPASALRVAVHHGGGQWGTTTVHVDSAQGQTVVTFKVPADTDGISVRREDAGNAHVAWEVS